MMKHSNKEASEEYGNQLLFEMLTLSTINEIILAFAVCNFFKAKA
jgi:hypothetical protein